jgi:peptide/nickel transport system substrate-binding protein
VVSALLLLAALAAAPAAGGELVVGTVADPVRLDLHAATDLLSAAVAANACEPLVRVDERQRVRGLLAGSWATRDNRTWTLTLRSGIHFQDGTPFDAAAVVTNLDDLRAKGRFEGTARRIGSLAVSIRLDAPNAALLATLSQPLLGMQSPRQLRTEGSGLPVCSGPFRLVSAAAGTVRLERHTGYWGTPARLAALVFRSFASEEALVRALRSGEVDVAIGVSPLHAAGLRAEPLLRVRSWTGLNLAYLALNHDRPVFRDRKVREAVARAIDRERLVRDVLGGHGEPARNPLPPGLPGYALRTRELSLDRRLARRLLGEAGWPEPTLRLLVTSAPRTWNPDPSGLAARLRDDLQQVGVRVQTETAAGWSEYLQRVTAGDFDMAVLGWEADTLDANDFLVSLLSRAALGRTNRSRYVDERMEALLRQGRRGSDPRERGRTYAEVQRFFQREMPWVPLYHVAVFVAHRAEVQDLEIDATGILRYHHAWRDR